MNNTYFNLKVNSIPAGQFFKMAYVSDATLSALGRKAVSLFLNVLSVLTVSVSTTSTLRRQSQRLLRRISPLIPLLSFLGVSGRITAIVSSATPIRRVSIMSISVCMILPISPRFSTISMGSLFLRKTFVRLASFLIVISRLPMRLVV